MDFHALQHKLFAMDPTDPREDLRKLQAQAQGNPQKSVENTKDYVRESVEVPEGSLRMDKDYSVSDFAALAGVITEKKQRNADQVRASEPMPTAEPGRTKHPFQDRLVGDSIDNDDELYEPVKLQRRDQDPMAVAQRELQQGMQLIAQGSAMIDSAQEKIRQITSTLSDRELTRGEEREKERLVKGMKKNKDDFEDRYGDDAEAVMYATATKNAKSTSESIDNIKTDLYAKLNKIMGDK